MIWSDSPGWMDYANINIKRCPPLSSIALMSSECLKSNKMQRYIQTCRILSCFAVVPDCARGKVSCNNTVRVLPAPSRIAWSCRSGFLGIVVFPAGTVEGIFGTSVIGLWALLGSLSFRGFLFIVFAASVMLSCLSNITAFDGTGVLSERLVRVRRLPFHCSSVALLLFTVLSVTQSLWFLRCLRKSSMWLICSSSDELSSLSSSSPNRSAMTSRFPEQ